MTNLQNSVDDFVAFAQPFRDFDVEAVLCAQLDLAGL